MLSAEDTYDEMTKAYGSLVPQPRTIKKWFERFVGKSESIKDLPRTGRPKKMGLDIKIKEILNDEPFSSARYIAETLNESKTTVLRVLHEQLNYKKFNCKWIPHQLSNSNKLVRIEMAREMLSILYCKKYLWSNIITGDESWFYWYSNHTTQWLPSNSQRPEIPKQIVTN